MAVWPQGWLVLALLIGVCACGRSEDDLSISEHAEQGAVALVEQGDPAMEAAFAKARASLDDFLVLAANPKPGQEDFAVKVGIAEDGQTEYFWLHSPVGKNGRFSGIIGNTPQMVKRVSQGQSYDFQRSEIVDWTYLEPARNRMHGNFTACALLAKETPEDAAAFKRQYGLQCDGGGLK